MPVRLKFLMLAAALGLAGPVRAEGLKQIGSIAIPGNPITGFAAFYVDNKAGLAYFAEKDNKAVDIFDTKTDKYVGRITGFFGEPGVQGSGPNGVIAVNDSAELWVSDSDSTIKVIDPTSGKIVETISTGGKKRANAMAYDPKDHIVIVANPNDEPAFLTLISTLPGHKILSKIPVEAAAEGMERSDYYPPTGTFFTDVPMLRSDHSKGALAETDPKTGKLTIHELDHCNPHSIATVADGTMFLGCAKAPAGSAGPGAELAIFEVGTGKVSYLAGLGGSGDTTLNPALGHYYHSATNLVGGPMLRVIDIKSRALVQAIPTWNGSHSMGVGLAQNHVYLPTTAKDGPCGGCILIFAPQ